MSLRNPKELYDGEGKVRGWRARWLEGGRGSRSHCETFLKEDGWTKKKVRDWCDVKLAERAGLVPERHSYDMTLAEAAGRWIESRPDLEAKTLEGYESVLRLYAGSLADMSMGKITPADVRDELYAMRDAGRSRSRTSELRSALNKVFQWAIDSRVISVNPAKDMKIPNPKRGQADEDEVVLPSAVATPEQVDEFIDLFDPYWRPVPRTIKGTGIRSGETEALDVDDWDGEILTINKALSTAPERFLEGGRVKPPKSAAGRRRIRVPSELRPILDAVKGDRTEGPLFVGPRGGRLNMNNLRNRQWADALRAWEELEAERQLNAKPDRECLSFPMLNPHGLRHFKASMMLDQGRTVAEIAAVLGHANPNVTFQVYVHFISDDGVVAA